MTGGLTGIPYPFDKLQKPRVVSVTVQNRYHKSGVFIWNLFRYANGKLDIFGIF